METNEGPMTKKDFKWFVKFITEHRIDNSGVLDLVEYFKFTNDKFDQSKFLNAVYEAKCEYERKSHEIMDRMIKRQHVS